MHGRSIDAVGGAVCTALARAALGGCSADPDLRGFEAHFLLGWRDSSWLFFSSSRTVTALQLSGNPATLRTAHGAASNP